MLICKYQLLSVSLFFVCFSAMAECIKPADVDNVLSDLNGYSIGQKWVGHQGKILKKQTGCLEKEQKYFDCSYTDNRATRIIVFGEQVSDIHWVRDTQAMQEASFAGGAIFENAFDEIRKLSKLGASRWNVAFDENKKTITFDTDACLKNDVSGQFGIEIISDEFWKINSIHLYYANGGV